MTRGVADTWLLVLPWDLRHPGGVNQVVENLFDVNQSELGNRSLLLVKRWEADPPERAIVDGRLTLYARCRNPWERRRPWRSALTFVAGLPRAIRQFRRLLRSENLTRVNVHYPELDAMIWLALKPWLPRRPPLILSFHGIDLEMAAATSGIARHLWSRLLLGAEQIIVCSTQLRTQFERAFGAMPQLRVIDNGVDPDALLHKAAASAVPLPSANYIVSLATFEEKKGLDVLLQAFDAVAEQHPEVELVIAGRLSDPRVLEGLQQQRLRSRFADRIRLLPDVAHGDAMRLLQHASMFVLPSRREPFGIAVLEAGVFGRPVVATSVCGVALKLEPGVDLLTVAPDDAGALTAAIGRILADAAFGRRLAAALRERVNAEFTWTKIAHQYAALAA